MNASLRIAPVAALALSLCGCAVLEPLLDWFGGVGPDGNPTGDPPGSGIFSFLLNAVLPGSGVVAGGLGAWWADHRRRVWKRLAEATFDGVEQAARAGTPAALLKGELAVAHTAAGVADLARATARRQKRRKTDA